MTTLLRKEYMTAMGWNTYLKILVLSLLCSCSAHPPDVEDALQQAGDNRKELEKVIGHYSRNPQDSLKLKAAYFLIGNMPGHYFYKGTLLDGYFSLLDSTLDSSKYDRIRTIFDAYSAIHGAYTPEASVRVRDIDVLKADYLIRNIDQAFGVWQKQPWGKDITFKTFCEYILPYRLADEAPEEWRRELFARYNPLLDSVRADKGDVVAACQKVCSSIKDSLSGGGWAAFLGVLPAFGPGRLTRYNIGTCREQAHFAAYVMRALGIPVAVENTPQWPFRSMGHTWNAVIKPDGKGIRFMGTETAPGEPHKEDHKYAKIFRETFSRNPESLAVRAGHKAGPVPFLFRNPFFLDVTAEYVPVATIKLDAGAVRAGGYVYLSVFDNQNWVPIDWAQVDEANKATFSHVGRNVVYLLSAYTQEGVVGASYPVKVKADGSYSDLVPLRRVQQLVLKRKYPLDKHLHMFLQRMRGGRFQVSNRPDFSDAKDVYLIEEAPSVKKHTVGLGIDGYRYVRYLGPAGGHCNIAEMEVIGKEDRELKGEIIGTDSSWAGFDRSKVFDKDIVTFFEAPMKDSVGAWVGLDLGTPTTMTAIRFMPRNDGNTIEKGDRYELFFWSEGWKSLGVKIAASDSLVYKGVPGGALYLLRNRTKGKEERIFTYGNGTQNWW